MKRWEPFNTALPLSSSGNMRRRRRGESRRQGNEIHFHSLIIFIEMCAYLVYGERKREFTSDLESRIVAHGAVVSLLPTSRIWKSIQFFAAFGRQSRTLLPPITIATQYN
jgi:hypothetical protein